MELKQRIEKIWEDRSLLQSSESQELIRAVVEKLDKGELRVAEPAASGWQVNEWIKKAVILYFPIQQMETIEVGPFEFHDKIKLKRTNPLKLAILIKHKPNMRTAAPIKPFPVKTTAPLTKWVKEVK